MLSQSRTSLGYTQRTVHARRFNASRQVVASASQPERDRVSLQTASLDDQEVVPSSRTAESHIAWGEQISDLKLHTEDALFHTWRPNCRVHYLQSGVSGPPLLLIHGFGVGSFHFEKNLGELGKHHRVWACDLFGQGASWPARPPEKHENIVYSIDTWTDQLAAFICDVIKDTGGVYVAGNSLGGLLAMHVAYKHPELVRGLILLNATPFWTVYSLRALAPLGLATVPLPAAATQRVRAGLFGYLSRPSTISTFLQQVYVDKDAIDERLVQRMAAAAGHPHAADAFLSMMLSPRGGAGLGAMAKAVSACGTPICLMHGRQDPWVRAWWARRLKRQVPSVEYYSISPAGHCPHHEVPDTVNALIRQWIRAKEAGEGPIMRAGELWRAGPEMSLERAEAAGGAEAGGREGGGDGEAALKQPVVVELASGEPLNWLEGLTF